MQALSAHRVLPWAHVLTVSKEWRIRSAKPCPLSLRALPPVHQPRLQTRAAPSVGAWSADLNQGNSELLSADQDSLGHLLKTQKLREKGLTNRKPRRERGAPLEHLGKKHCFQASHKTEPPRELAARHRVQLQTNAVGSETQGEPTGPPHTLRVQDTWHIHERHR